MAKKPSLGYGLSRAATIAGWCYLPFYLFLLSYLIQYVAALLGLHPSMLTVNLIYFAVNLAVVLIIFHDFLRQRFFGPGFWNFVQAIILGFVLYYAATWAVRFALDKLAPGYTIYNNETVGELVLADEVFTPDSSRFWNRDEYQVGTSPLSYDKQYLRDWLIENKLDGVTPAPQLPADVVAKTQEKYLECLERLVPQK